MANTIRDYSATPASNTVVDGADISEGCSPAGINDAIRGVMSDLKDVSTGAVALESPAADSLSVTGNVSAATFSGDGSSLTGIPTPTLTSLGIANHDDITVDGSGNVGIGTSSPSGLQTTLNIDGGSTGASLALDGGSNFAVMFAGSTASDPTSLYSNTGFKFATATAKDATGFTERMRIDGATGNVGIGTSSPSGVLAVTDGSNGLTIGQSNENFHAANTHRFYSQNYSTEHMRIDASGRVTMPYQPSFLAGGMSATQTTDTSIPFNSTGGTGGHNIGNHFSTSTGKFTCPIAGRYFFSFNLLSNDTRQNYFYAHLRKNGSVVKFTQEIKSNSTTSGATISTSMVVDCAANDVVDVFGYGSSVNIHSSNQYTWFSGYLLG